MEFLSLLLLVSTTLCTDGFTTSGANKESFSHLFSVQNPQTSLEPGIISVEKYNHKDWELTYLFKEAAPGRESDSPIILVHPVGVGISSWFYTRLMTEFTDNPPIYAPDLIGCGLAHGADAWDPEVKGMFFPLSWTEGVETLIDTIAMPRWREKQIVLGSSFGKPDSSTGCIVLVQGGLAPVGALIAARNPSTVSSLILTSPPIYKDMITAVPSTELEKNYNFLKSPIFGQIAFSILESRGIIEFFSNQFLFSRKCDSTWLDETEKEMSILARPPIQAFNAGLLQHRSFEDELKRISQPTYILSGAGDKRAKDRVDYGTELQQCTLITLDGTNVIPWESPIGVIDLIKVIL